MAEIKRIQLSPTPIIKDVTTVWQDPGEGTDIQMDLRSLTFASASLDAIYAFHVIDHLTFEDAGRAIKNWFFCLKPKGMLYVIVDNFEFVARSFVGGDISIHQVNAMFSHPSQYTQDNLFSLLHAAGFPDPSIKMWFSEVPGLFKTEEHELVLSAEK